jgi:predicted aconitase with swiveling domain
MTQRGIADTMSLDLTKSEKGRAVDGPVSILPNVGGCGRGALVLVASARLGLAQLMTVLQHG